MDINGCLATWSGIPLPVHSKLTLLESFDRITRELTWHIFQYSSINTVHYIVLWTTITGVGSCSEISFPADTTAAHETTM